jgi:hypothetical protein
MGQILCQDIFNQISQHIPYQQRPQSLTINKQLNTLYTNSYLIQDKQTFSNLNDILNNEIFFEQLIGKKYKEFLKFQNHHTINFIHDYAFKKRELTTELLWDEDGFIVVPSTCLRKTTQNSYVPPKLYIIVSCLRINSVNYDLSYIDIFNYNIYDIGGKYFFKNDSDPEEFYTFCNISCARCHISPIRKQQYHTEYLNTLTNPQTIHMSNIVYQYESYEKLNL